MTEQLLLLPSGSIPQKITTDVLFGLDTIQNSEGIDYISHKDMFYHIGEKLDSNAAGINFSLDSIEVSNKTIFSISEKEDEKRVSVRKVMAKFKSDVVWDNEGKHLTILYSTHYKENRFEITYAIGFDVRACGNGNIIGASDIIRRSGKTMSPVELDPFLDSWLLRYEEKIDHMKHFTKKLSEIELPLKKSNEFLGKMIQDIVKKPQKISDANVFMDAMRHTNSEKNKLFGRDKKGNISAWNLYNNFTEALKGEELSSRFRKHANISEYFLQEL
jgi:hypothetical protein